MEGPPPAYKSMTALENRVYQFKGFELDPAEHRLLSEGKPVALTPKVFDTLVLLVQRAGHIVSKDELLRTLWPRGYVDESNLTKHIWLIRRALGDKEGEASRFIETIPKVGYRFVAAVTVREPSAVMVPEPAAAPPELAHVGTVLPVGRPGRVTARAPWYLRPTVLGAATAALLVAALAAWRLDVHSEAGAHHAGRTVAFVGFSNLSRNPKDAWLSPALTEMLSAELSVSDDLRVLPDELIRDSSADISAPAAGGYSLATLERLRRRLDADYVVSGSYLVTGAQENAPLRVDIALQDARNGALLASVSNQSGVAGLLALVTSAGVTLRDKLGTRPAAAQDLSLIANVQPPNVDIARRIGFALDAMQHYDAARARDELLEAIAEAPAYAPAYAQLAQAWAALGYREKSQAAAAQAAHWAANLPQEQRLLAAAVLASSGADRTAASEAWQRLVRLKPANAEYRLECLAAQLAASSVTQAQQTLDELQRLPGAGSDPRVELAAARIASSRDDAKGAAQHAAAALQQAQVHEAPGLIAPAQLQLGEARERLGQHEQARANFEAAIAGYRTINNPRGEAAARRALAAGPLSAQHRIQAAREEYQRAMALDQSIGDLAGQTRVYADLCGMLWQAGDRDGAQAAARHGLQLSRDTGDLPMQGWMLRALATIASDDSASEEVLNEYREVASLSERIGDRGGHSWSLASYADVQRMRGDLTAARATCVRATAEATALSDPQFIVYSGFTCALVDLDRGDAVAARAALERVIDLEHAGGSDLYANNARMTLAQLDMDAARWSDARAELRVAAGGFAGEESETGEADAQALLALCDQQTGNREERDQARQRAQQLRQAITSRQEIYVVDIALAQLPATPRGNPAAVEQLLALAADAERRQWISWSLEARLAAWEVLHARGSSGALALQRDLESSARKYGFGRIVNRLHRYDHLGEPHRAVHG